MLETVSVEYASGKWHLLGGFLPIASALLKTQLSEAANQNTLAFPHTLLVRHKQTFCMVCMVCQQLDGVSMIPCMLSQ